MAAKRRPRQTKARAEAETEILEKGRWSQLRANDRLHTPAENNAARHRCRQLIDGGVEAVDWVELYGQKYVNLTRDTADSTKEKVITVDLSHGLQISRIPLRFEKRV